MGVLGAEELGVAVAFAGEEEGELVGLGAACGDQGVAGCRGLLCRPVTSAVRALVTRASSSEAAGAWSQESREGLRAEAARSAAVATARGGQWRCAAQRGWAGSAAPSAKAWTRVRRASFVAVVGEGVAEGLAQAGGDGGGAAGGEGADAGGCAGGQRVQHGGEQRPQGGGALGA